MPITLAAELESVVQAHVATGRYKSEQEVLCEALKLLESRESLITAIQSGDRQFDEGKYREFDLESLRTYRAELLSRIAKTAASE
jgi:putative addiction module CopG family antidote